MAAHPTVIPELDANGLRNFGITTGAIIAVLFGLLFPWIFERSLPLWPWIVFGVLAFWGLAAPTTLRPVYHGWMRFGLLISKVTTPIVLGVVFFVVILPFGLVRRLIAADAMAREFDNDAKSYRVDSDQPTSDSLEHPY